MIKKVTFFYWLVLSPFVFQFAYSQDKYVALDSSVLAIRKVADSLQIPWEILWGPDDHIWFTERVGNVNRLNPETGKISRLLTIKDCFNYTSSGLLGMALHPDFDKEPFVFLAYTSSPSDSSKIVLRIQRYRYDKVNQKLTEGRDLIQPIYEGSFGAYGCRLVATKKGELFATIGDAGDYSLPQDTNKLEGKILRITFDGKPFPGNPFHNEIYSYGHRNPQGLVLGTNGILYSSEHGPTHDDEINIIELGGNYGWPTVGGITDEKEEFAFAQTHKVVDAIEFWTPTLAVCGLDYYPYSAIPEFHNSLLLCTLKAHDLRVLSLDSTGRRIVGERVVLDSPYGRLRDVCISPDGRVYFSTSNDKHHPDQMKAAFDAIYELRFDHRQDPAVAKLVAKEEATGKVNINWLDRLKIIVTAVVFLLLMVGLYSFSGGKDS